MKYGFLASVFAAASLAALAGCAGDENARYVDSGGARAIVSANKINIADWNAAVASIVNELISSGALDKISEPKPIRLLVSRVENGTSEVVDVDMLTKKICIALNNSGKALAVSSDAATQNLAKQRAAEAGRKIPLPQITLTGKILEDRESNSSMREVTYTFFVEVNYDGDIVWQGEKQITKQQKKGTFGL